MWNALRNRLPGRRQMFFALMTLTLSGIAFYIGKRVGIGPASAQQLEFNTNPVAPGASPAEIGDYSKRVVATVFDKYMITRADLAEHLIARFGKERIEYLVNRKILEIECAKHNVYITDSQVEAQFKKDLYDMKVTEKQFHDQILKRFNKTVFEWKEDVIRPKLALNQLVQPQIVVTHDDVKKGFEATYGPKVRCRMIVYPRDTSGGVRNRINDIWLAIKNSTNVTAAFLEEAEKQPLHNLAATKGEIPPIHMHFPDPQVEREVFALKPGQISRVMSVGDTEVIFLCEAHIPQDTTKVLDNERSKLEKEIFDRKTAQAVAQYFPELRKRANPRYYGIERGTLTQEDLARDVQQTINQLQRAPSGN